MIGYRAEHFKKSSDLLVRIAKKIASRAGNYKKRLMRELSFPKKVRMGC
jgi:hypothetical protein